MGKSQFGVFESETGCEVTVPETLSPRVLVPCAQGRLCVQLRTAAFGAGVSSPAWGPGEANL